MLMKNTFGPPKISCECTSFANAKHEAQCLYPFLRSILFTSTAGLKLINSNSIAFELAYFSESYTLDFIGFLFKYILLNSFNLWLSLSFSFAFVSARGRWIWYGAEFCDSGCTKHQAYARTTRSLPTKFTGKLHVQLFDIHVIIELWLHILWMHCAPMYTRKLVCSLISDYANIINGQTPELWAQSSELCGWMHELFHDFFSSFFEHVFWSEMRFS